MNMYNNILISLMWQLFLIPNRINKFVYFISLGEMGGRLWTGYVWLRVGTSGGSSWTR